ncbi:MAG: cytochrome c oxidase accessory protein CcoG [Bdellovibrionales bacterium]|nr:cytochrome c oxidase accessory protein CcoG [Bdellovibrionales bacterium]
MTTKIPSRELPEESLGSLDEFGNRLFIYPATVRGAWNRLRKRFHFILLIIFLILPWLRWHGNPLLQLDVVHRKFIIFGLTLWAQDGPLIFFVLAGFVITLFFITSLWGRVWCGWACPQTVFIEMVFRKLEYWFEGTHLERRRLNEGPFTLNKLWKKTGKWFAFFIASWIVGNTFLSYFVGTERLLQMISVSPWQNPESFLVMAFTTLVTLFDFGWFREQFCIIMCPYGRFQSVLMDHQSSTIIYDYHRGEPRKGSSNLLPGQKTGDCINCFKCVAVCPTAIDIRRGQQMECIACTACIDACDEVMEKMQKPKGLIRYGSGAELELVANSKNSSLTQEKISSTPERTKVITPSKPQKKFTTRSLIYLALLIIINLGLVYSLFKRQTLPLTILRGIETPYRTILWNEKEPGFLNHFRLSLQNHFPEPISFKIRAEDFNVPVRIIIPPGSFVASGTANQIHCFVEFPATLLENKKGVFDLKIIVEVYRKDISPTLTAGSESKPFLIKHETVRLLGSAVK